ncbi:hypothetical protein AVEN_266639-1, partial [Araneus ventricosus]
SRVTLNLQGGRPNGVPTYEDHQFQVRGTPGFSKKRGVAGGGFPALRGHNLWPPCLVIVCAVSKTFSLSGSILRCYSPQIGDHFNGDLGDYCHSPRRLQPPLAFDSRGVAGKRQNRMFESSVDILADFVEKSP